MFKRVTLLSLLSLVMMGLVSCGEPAPQPAAQSTVAAAPKKEEPATPVYDITKDNITDHADWTSKSVGILGARIGDVTTKVQDKFGKMDNTRTLAEEYLTVYQNNGIFVYTHKLTGKMRKFELYQTFSKQIVDPKFKKLLDSGDLKYMREAFGQEEKTEENIEDPASPGTEYAYDAKGFRFVQYKVGKGTLNALRFSEIKK